MTKNDGGPAFPGEATGVSAVTGHARYYPVSGMSMRDYFAGQALAGLMSCKFPGKGDPSWQELVAWDAYSIADTMLRERLKPE